jgi:phytoene/squalene synthetase
MDPALAACAALVERGDSDRFLAAMAAPPAAREVLFPLFAFNLEIARAPWVTAEPVIAEMRLQWWRDMLAEAASGAPPRAHEVAAPLARLIRDRGLDVAPLDAAVAARRWDIWREPFADDAALWAHLEATSGGILQAAAQALGAGPAVLPGLRLAARSGGLAGWLVAVPAYEARGRLPLPDGRPQAVQALARQGLADLALAHRTDFGTALPALRSLWRTGPVLRRALRDPMAVAEGRLTGAEFPRRAGMLWKVLTGGW